MVGPSDPETRFIPTMAQACPKILVLVNAMNEEYFAACEKGDINRFKGIVGVDYNCRDAKGNTALISASSWNRLDIVEFLVSNGVNLDMINVDGHTALMEATIAGNLAVVKNLITNGANVTIKNKYPGDNALIFACMKNHTDIAKEIVKALITKGDKSTIYVKDAWDKTPFDYFSEKASKLTLQKFVNSLDDDNECEVCKFACTIA